MKKRLLLTAFVVGLATLLSACCMICSKNGNFTMADAGKTFKTATGGTLNLDLKGNYTTGYSWNIVSCDDKILKLDESPYTPDSTQLAGAGGVQHYKFSIVGAGQTELKITYNRVWEKDVAPAETFTLKIDSKK